MKIKNIVGLTLVILAIAGCNSEKTPALSSANSDSVSQCVARGVAYFKEMGSYPTLNSPPNVGVPAEDVALERCNRTLTAF
jgi:hypothetical protein